MRYCAAWRMVLDASTPLKQAIEISPSFASKKSTNKRMTQKFIRLYRILTVLDFVKFFNANKAFKSPVILMYNLSL